MKTATLNLIAHHTDNGDGSTSVHFFNNREELEKDLEEHGSNFGVEEIESGDDPYEYGTLSEHSFDIEIDPETGLAKLAQSVTLSSDS